MCCPERQGRSDQTHASHMRNWEESLVDPWVDSSEGSKRQSLLDLTAGKGIYSDPRKVGTETAVVNASNQYHGQILQPRAESIQQGHCG